MEHDAFVYTIRSTGDLAGVFEFDGDTSYFYLYELHGDDSMKILDAIFIGVGEPDYLESDIEIGWSPAEGIVFIKIFDKLRAVFDCDLGKKYGGNLPSGVELFLPKEVRDRLG